MAPTAGNAALCSSSYVATAPASPDHVPTSEAAASTSAADASSPATFTAASGEGGRDRHEQQEDKGCCDDRQDYSALFHHLFPTDAGLSRRLLGSYSSLTGLNDIYLNSPSES